MAWLVLVVSGAFEAVWAVALGRSEGFSRLVPSVVFVAALALSMGGLAWAMRTLPVGTSYAVWVGVGATATVAFGMATGEEAVVGPLEQTIDLLHVDDVARGLVAAAGEGVAQTTAVRAAEPVTVGQIIAALDRVGGRSLRYRVDEARAVSDLPLHAGAWPAPPGWSPAWSLDRGLAQLVG